jgi:mercuric reductase
MNDVRELVGSMRKAKYEDLLKKFDNVDLYVGMASFRSHNEIVVKNGERRILRGEKIIIATGSSPYIPNIPGIDGMEYYTSNTIWELDRDISSMLIIGSGAVGLELAQSFSRLGVKVYIIEVLDRVIPKTEPELSRELTRILSEEGIEISLKSRVVSLEKSDDGVKARVIGHEGEKTVHADTLLIATGRKPNTTELRVENAGVKLDSRGMVVVDKYLRTTNPNVYAAGDVSNTVKPALLETLSAKEGATAAENIVKGNVKAIDHIYFPVVVFVDPQLAFVGLSEEDVMMRTGACQCRVVRFESMAKSGIIGRGEGLAKLIVDPYTNVMMGFHVLAPEASEFIGQASIMIKHRYKVEDIIDTPTVFPSISEIIKLSAQAFIRRIDMMPCCVE